MRLAFDLLSRDFRLLAAAALAAIAVPAACARAAAYKEEIRFARGASKASVRGAVVRGDLDLYYLGARAGQTMHVEISSVEKNAVFQLYRPGAKVAEIDGFTEIKGRSLPKAGEGDDATAWKGKLPANGRYLIVVGGTRGNATYRLTVSIR